MTQETIAIGLMSGTSLDGIDAALVTTDGRGIIKPGASLAVPYTPSFQKTLRTILAGEGDMLLAEKQLTELHAEAVQRLLKKADKSAKDVDVIGFHGQTIIHRPEDGITQQMGNGALLAYLTGIDVVNDFRRQDMAAGGHGAPLVPIYHAALTAAQPKPVVIINIGGVSNITWIGSDNDLAAFDTGPGNALLDDWIRGHSEDICDVGGKYSAAGTIRSELLDNWMQHSYFQQKPPKSLDRNSFDVKGLDTLSCEDGAATLVMFTVEAIARAMEHVPSLSTAYYVTGGGRHNPTIMEQLNARLNAEVKPVEALGWDGDMLEAQAFGYLAVRTLQHLPITFPQTTGVKQPMPGGAFYRA